MKKEFRVKSKQDFQKVIKGKKISNECFTLYMKDNEISHPRFGISASKKLGNAVIRSTIRRKIRAMLQTMLKENNFRNKDFVLIVRKKFLENSYYESLNSLKELFQNYMEVKHEEKTQNSD